MDIIQHNGNWVIVNSISNNKIKVIRPWNKEIISVVPETSTFGFSFYNKIINPFDNFDKTATANENNPFGNIFPFLLLNNDNNNNNNSMNDIMMLMMMNGKIDVNNSLLFYAVMNDKNNLNLLSLLILFGNNPFNIKNNENGEYSLQSFYPTYTAISTNNIKKRKKK